MKKVDVLRADGSLLCHADLADGVLTRGRGLLGRAFLKSDEGLLIEPCTSVHTMFMRFPIDVIYLDRDYTVVKVASMPAFRMSFGGRGSKRVLELPLHAIEQKGIFLNEQLTIRPA